MFNIKKWWLQGSENDKYYLELTTLDRYYYQIGLKLFTNKFWCRNNLGEFTENKTGREYIQGVVSRGKWLRKNFPFRSSPFNMFDFFVMIPKMLGTGPDAESRILLNKVVDFFRFS